MVMKRVTENGPALLLRPARVSGAQGRARGASAFSADSVSSRRRGRRRRWGPRRVRSTPRDPRTRVVLIPILEQITEASFDSTLSATSVSCSCSSPSSTRCRAMTRKNARSRSALFFEWFRQEDVSHPLYAEVRPPDRSREFRHRVSELAPAKPDP